MISTHNSGRKCYCLKVKALAYNPRRRTHGTLRDNVSRVMCPIFDLVTLTQRQHTCWGGPKALGRGIPNTEAEEGIGGPVEGAAADGRVGVSPAIAMYSVSPLKDPRRTPPKVEAGRPWERPYRVRHTTRAEQYVAHANLTQVMLGYRQHTPRTRHPLRSPSHSPLSPPGPATRIQLCFPAW